MGLFGQNYNAEGPGVSKDAAEKRGFFAFFELYGRKFTSLVKVNLIYFVLILPTLLGFILTGNTKPQGLFCFFWDFSFSDLQLRRLRLL